MTDLDDDDDEPDAPEVAAPAEVTDIRTARAGLSLTAAQQSGIDPERAARAQHAAAVLGLPAGALTIHPDAAAQGVQRAQIKQATSSLAYAPATAAWLDHPHNAAVVAPPEVPLLAQVESHIVSAFTGLPADPGLWRQLTAAAAGGAAPIGQGFGAMMSPLLTSAGDETTPGALPGTGAFTFTPNSGPVLTHRQGNAAAEQIFSPLTTFAKATPAPKTFAEHAASLLGSALPYVAAGAAAPLAMASQGYGDVENAAEASGQEDAGWKGWGNALAQLGWGAAMGPLARLGGAIAPTISKPAFDVVSRFAGGATAAAGTGAGMQATTNLFTGRPLTEGMASNAATIALFHGITALPEAARDLHETTQAHQDGAQAATAFNQAADALNTSGLPQRAPERTRALINEMAPGESVYLPADAVQKYLQADGSGYAAFEAAGVTDQIAPAIAGGHDVVVPAADYLAHIAPTKAHETLADELRLTPDGQSIKDAAQFNESFPDFAREKGRALSDAATRAATEDAPKQRVFETVFGQLREAGYSIDTARMQAQLVAEYTATRAARLNEGVEDRPLQTDTWEQYQRGPTGTGPIDVRQEFAPELKTQWDGSDVLIDALRRSKKPLQDQGPSLLDFLSRNGIADPEGDLKALDADKWHREKPFRRQLVREDGQSMEDAARRAYDAGYFPEKTIDGTTGEEGSTEPVQPSDLKEAIRDELFGNKRFAVPLDERRASFRTAVDELDRITGTLGIDPEKATNAEIKKAVDAYAARPEGTYEQPERGSISFPRNSGPVIRLSEARNLSTFLHEYAGHGFLEGLRADAALPDAPQGIKDDWTTVKRHIGLGDEHDAPGSVIPTDAHETFARSAEAYLMEGRSPSKTLRAAFSRFKAWLIGIYKQASALNVHLTDDIRGVFDRLIATDVEIMSAKDAAGLKAVDPRTLGMSEAEGAAYRKMVQDQTGQATDAVLAKVMGDIRRQRTKAWNEELEHVREEEAAPYIDGSPAVRALHYLTRGVLLGHEGEQPGRVRLNSRDVADIYGSETALANLPRSVPPIHTDKPGEGVHPDAVAELTGFNSGEAMLNAVMGLEADRRARIEASKGADGKPKDNRSVRTFLTDQEADRLMADRHGDVLTDGSIQEEALTQIHEGRSGEVLAAELRALSRKTKTAETPLAYVERWARDYISGRRYADLQPHIYLRAEKSASTEFERALVGGGGGAIQAKQRQLLNHVLYREAKAAQTEADAIVKRMDKLASPKTLKSMDQGYLDRIHELLERYSFKRVTQREVARRKALVEWMTDERNAGEPIQIDPRIVDRARLTHYSDLSVSEMQGLGDTVANLAHLGRLKQKLLDGKELRDRDALLDEVWSNAEQLKDPYVARSHAYDRATNKTVGGHIADFWSGLSKPEKLIDYLDLGDPNGPLNRALLRPLADGQAIFNGIMKDTLDPVQRAYSEVPREQRRSWRRKIDAQLADIPDAITGQRDAEIPMDKRGLMAMALNWSSNREKLVGGWDWDEAHLKDLLDRHLTREDWQLVQTILDHVGKLRDPYFKAVKRMTGVEPEAVEFEPIETPHGAFPGGYFPIKYDPTRNPHLNQLRSQSAEDVFNGAHVAASLPMGPSISRTEYKGPILLDFEAALFDHLPKVGKVIAYGDALRSVKSLIEHPKFKAIVESKLGTEPYSEFKPWLMRIIGYRLDDPKAIHGLTAALRQFRSNVMTTTAPLNPVVLIEHGTAYTQSIAVIGPKWFGRGMAEYMAHGGPFMNMNYVHAHSIEMAQRMERVNRDFRDYADDLHRNQTIGAKIENATGLPTKLLDQIPHLAHFPVTWINHKVIAFPTWIGARAKALAPAIEGGLGMSEEEAIHYADKAVRISHSDGNPMNMSRVQDPGNEWAKLGTIFYGFHNAQLNLLQRAGFNFKNARTARQASNAMATMFLLGVVGPAITAMTTGRTRGSTPGSPEWWEDIADELPRALWNGVPYVRDIANFAFDKLEGKSAEYHATPIERAMMEVGKGVTDVGRFGRGALPGGENVKPPSEAWIKHLIELPGYALGWPMLPFARAAQYEHDVQTGKEQPANALEHAGGLLFGAPHTKH